MADHRVRVTFPKDEIEAELRNRDMVFRIKVDGKAFGYLMVSKGGVWWKPKHGKKGTKMSWSKFAARLREE